MGKLDATSRATFHHIAAQGGVCPTNRELRWLKHIERHGPQASTALIDLSTDTHRCRDTALRALQRLRAGGFLYLPPQQRSIERSEFNPYIYDITPQARTYLAETGALEDAVRPTGHFWHAYTTSALTSAIDRSAARSGINFVPARTILNIRQASLGIPTGSNTIIPDQLFALDYGGSFRAFVLEVDRGTEPTSSRSARESLHRKLAAYSAIFSHGQHRQHYGLKSPIVLLFTFTSRLRAKRLLEDIASHWPNLAPVTLVQAVAPQDRLVLQANTYVAAPWQRASGDTIDLFRR
jgi:hypothetical protein